MRARVRLSSCVAILLLGAGADPGPAAAQVGDPLREQQWGMDAVHAADAHRVTRGAGARVAVLDTGVDADHPDLAGAIDVGPDFVDGSGAGHDFNGHGTHVAGVIGARGDNGVGIAGAAPGARVLAIRVLGAEKTGTTDVLAKGIEAAVDARVDVINLSLSAGPTAPDTILPTSPLVQAIERAAGAGVVIVAAAGNNALPLCEQPIVRARILCVGAVDRRLERSDFTNYGHRVDMVAPGGSTDPARGTIVAPYTGGGYAGMSGTSQATPFVAATAALLVASGLRGPAAIDRILATAQDLGAAGADATYGAGLLDMRAAVGADRLPPATAPAPAAQASTQRGPRVSAPRRQRLSTFLRRGLRVRCRLAQAGTCALRLTDRGGRLLGRGSARVRAGATRRIVVRPTAAARRRLRRGRGISCRLTARASGVTVRRAVRLTAG